MKKFISSVMMFCCAMAMPVQAENTDISTLDNVVYIEPVSIAAGSQHTLSVKMKNAVEAEGFGFDLYLPEGITVATDGDGFPLVELSTERTTARKTNSFDAAFQSDGCLRVLAASTNASTISGNDGEVCLITIQVTASVSPSDYPMYLRNVAISDTQAQSHRTNLVESTITVTAHADTRSILDETSTTAPAAATGVDVLVKRTINNGEWSTICLPFAMTEEQVKEAFGSGVQLGKFSSWSAEEDGSGAIVGINVGFETVTAIEANVPLIIKPSVPVTEFSVDGVDIEPDETRLQVGKKSSERGYMYGNYVNGFKVPEESVFLSGGKFYYSVGNTPMMGYRAYFEFKEVLDAYYDVAPARLNIVIDGAATGMQLQRVATDNGRCYNLSGQPVEYPTKGLYISNGKKYIVK